LAQIGHELHGTPAPHIPTGEAFTRMVTTHYEAMLMFYGPTHGLRVARKHLGWYMDHANTPAALRHMVLTASTAAEVLALLPDALGGTTHNARQAA
jgi:tRNA-dihydrouridine synthase B